jgi:site-specific recombinase XerD
VKKQSSSSKVIQLKFPTRPVSIPEIPQGVNTNAYSLLNSTLIRIEGAYAPATIRAYKVDLTDLIAFCDQDNQIGLPASPNAVSNFIIKLMRDGRTSASIRRAIAGIASIHKLNRFEDPTKDPDVILEMRRMHRTIGRASKQAQGITAGILENLLAATEAGNRGARDRALLLIAYDTLCRRSELVALRIEDVQINITNGTEKTSILLRRSKTDQNGMGKRLHLNERAQKALKEWLERLQDDRGPLFRGVNRAQKITRTLGAGQINRIYKRLAARANLDEELIEKISGHSMRVGHAQDLVISGASMPQIMSKGRWSKTDTVMRYVEHIDF